MSRASFMGVTLLAADRQLWLGVTHAVLFDTRKFRMKNTKLWPTALACMSIIAALSVLPLSSSSAQAVGDNMIHACYIPSSGMVYRVSAEGVEGLKEECSAKGHIEFSWPAGLPLLGQTCPTGEFVVGVDATGAPVCAAPPVPETRDADDDGWTVKLGDCDDNDPNVHPGLLDGQPGNGVDNDCDGFVDGTTYAECSPYSTCPLGVYPTAVDCHAGPKDIFIRLGGGPLSGFQVEELIVPVDTENGPVLAAVGFETWEASFLVHLNLPIDGIDEQLVAVTLLMNNGNWHGLFQGHFWMICN